MIWLKENDKITCNRIIGDKDKLNKLIEEMHAEIHDRKKLKLSWCKSHIGGELPSGGLDGYQYIENEYLGHNGNGAIGNIYVCRGYDIPKPMSLQLVSEVLKLHKSYNIDLLSMLNYDVEQINMISQMHGSLDVTTFQFLMNNLWEDFNFFANEILEHIEIKKTEHYSISELGKIQRLSQKNNINTNAGTILEIEPVAENNAKVLKLAQTIRK